MEHFTEVAPPLPCVFVVGPEGSRKTTFGMTAPGPIYVIGTEEGHELDAVYRHADGKRVLTTDIRRESADKYPAVWFGSYFGVWAQIIDAVTELQQQEPGTVLIDSGSDLFGMAAAHFNIVMERGEKPIPPLAYGQVYPLLRDLIWRLRGRHRIIMTVRLKDEYMESKATGRQVLNIWKEAEYLADHIVYMELNRDLNVVFGHGKKGHADGTIIANPTWDKMIESETHVPRENDDSRLYRLSQVVSKAWAYLDSNGFSFERRVVLDPDEAEKYVEYLRGIPTATQTATAA